MTAGIEQTQIAELEWDIFKAGHQSCLDLVHVRVTSDGCPLHVSINSLMLNGKCFGKALFKQRMKG